MTTHARRLVHLLRCSAADPDASARPQPTPLLGASPASAAAASIRPLTKQQLKSWIRDGFIVIQIDGVPEGFHEQVFAKSLALSEDAKHNDGAKVKLSTGGRILAVGAQTSRPPQPQPRPRDAANFCGSGRF